MWCKVFTPPYIGVIQAPAQLADRFTSFYPLWKLSKAAAKVADCMFHIAAFSFLTVLTEHEAVEIKYCQAVCALVINNPKFQALEWIYRMKHTLPPSFWIYLTCRDTQPLPGHKQGNMECWLTRVWVCTIPPLLAVNCIWHTCHTSCALTPGVRFTRSVKMRSAGFNKCLLAVWSVRLSSNVRPPLA